MNAAQQELQDKISNVVDDIDRSHLRRMQSEMHKCAAACCDDMKSSLDQTQDCINNCSLTVSKAQNFIQKEMARFQNRLERCALECQDEVKDKFNADTSEADMNKFRDRYESCAIKCIHTHIGLIPNMVKNIKEILSKRNFTSSVIAKNVLSRIADETEIQNKN